MFKDKNNEIMMRAGSLLKTKQKNIWKGDLNFFVCFCFYDIQKILVSQLLPSDNCPPNECPLLASMNVWITKGFIFNLI